jgi:nucleotide-binding universal stress UspA family protein
MLPLRNILHPTDFSERSEFAFHLASALARDYGAQLTILHVLQEPTVLFTEAIAPPRDDDHREELGRKLREIGACDPRLHVRHELVEGHPATEILRVAQATGADLIVMGTHGRRGLKRLIMGSVAAQVVQKAACPVLTVKTPFPEGAAEHEPVEEPALA